MTTTDTATKAGEDAKPSPRPISQAVYDRIANARYYLEAADKHPQPTRDAVHALLLLTAWENIEIADQELGAWVREDEVDARLYKDHRHKLKDAPVITRVIIGKPGTGTPVREVNYSTGKGFKKLREICLYGSADQKDLSKLFRSGWHLDGFRRGLVWRIQWVELFVKIHEHTQVHGAAGLAELVQPQPKSMAKRLLRR